MATFKVLKPFFKKTYATDPEKRAGKSTAETMTAVGDLIETKDVPIQMARVDGVIFHLGGAESADLLVQRGVLEKMDEVKKKVSKKPVETESVSKKKTVKKKSKKV